MRYALVGMVAACGGSSPPPDAGTRHVRVDEIRSTTTVAAQPSSIIVMVTLENTTGLDGGAIPSDLQVVVNARGTMTPVTSTDGSHYQLTIPGAAVEDEAVYVSVAIGEDQAISAVRMPGAFTVDGKTGSPAAPPFSVTWSPTGTPDLFNWRADAVAPAGHPGCAVVGPTAPPAFLDDSGALTVDQMISAQGPYDCMLVMALYKTNAGSVTGAVGPGSTIIAWQAQSIWP